MGSVLVYWAQSYEKKARGAGRVAKKLYLCAIIAEKTAFMKRSFFLFIAFVAALSVLAVPAKRTPFVFRQPDGTEIVVTLVGDEYEHAYLTAEGDTLVETLRDGAWWLEKPLGKLEKLEKLEYLEKPERLGAHRTTPLGHYPTLGAPRELVLLVEYPDCRFTYSADAFRRMLCEEGYADDGATGSARDYFVDQSRGLFTPDIEVVGPIMLPHPRAYYGTPTANMYDGQPWLMLTDAAPLVDDAVDFARFDNDGDGFVDNVFIFYAGLGQNDGGPLEAVWPHAANIWTYYALDCTLDGVRLGSYACTNEVTGAGRLTGIGTFAHEYSHVLGLPDLYSTLGADGVFSPGPFELMDSGSYNNEGRTPPNMSLYDRMVLGWTEPEELTAPETVVLEADGRGRRIATVKAEEYYLLENRQCTGWDAFLPAHGMLVWHIDYDARAWADNQVNVLAGHQRVDLIEADGVPTADSRDGDAFPGARQTTALNLTPWTGVPIDAAITEIREAQEGTVTFKFRGGGERIAAPTALEPTEVTPRGFTASWTAVPAVTDYEVVVWRGQEAVALSVAAEQPRTEPTTGLWTAAVSGLEASTTYRYAVVARDGERRSPLSNEVTLTTLPPTFDMLSPTDLAASPTAAGWTLTWTPLPEAAAYEVETYALQLVAPDVVTLDFTGGIAALPAGWTTTSTQTSGVAGTFGAARPSLLLQPGEWLQSAVFEAAIVDYNFWAAGEVEATLAADGRQLRISNTGDAPAYVDDVVVSYGGRAEHVGAEMRSTADKTGAAEAAAEPTLTLPAAQGQRYARVRGVRVDGVRSEWSTEVALPLLEGIGSVLTDVLHHKTQRYDLLGRPINGSPRGTDGVSIDADGRKTTR